MFTDILSNVIWALKIRINYILISFIGETVVVIALPYIRNLTISVIQQNRLFTNTLSIQYNKQHSFQRKRNLNLLPGRDYISLYQIYLIYKISRKYMLKTFSNNVFKMNLKCMYIVIRSRILSLRCTNRLIFSSNVGDTLHRKIILES